MEAFKNSPLVKKLGFNRILLCLILILMYAAFSILEPTFLSYSRVLSALHYTYFLGILALAVTFVIATGGIDFSIGTVMFCSALIAGQLLVKGNVPLPIAVLVSILTGMMFGIFNGFLVAYLGIPSFIASMASMMISKGLGSVVTKTQAISWPQMGEAGSGFRKLIDIRIGKVDYPMGLLLLLILTIVCVIFLNNTKPGRYILCLGSNKEAVRLSGVNVKKWESLAYILCGTFAGLAAIFYVGSYTTVLPGAGDTFNNEAIAGCVMGGTSMAGGIASMGGTFIGVLIISLLQEGILAMGFQKDYQYIITGIIVLLSVYADVRSRRRRN